MITLLYLLASFTLLVQNESARILAVFPTPLISHQSVHRAIIHELISRDHEVVLISPIPEFQRGQSPDNLMEIDVSNVTKEIWGEKYIPDYLEQSKGLKHVLQVGAKIIEKQFQVPELKSFVNNNETFDLLLLEAWIRPTLFWTYICDAPVVSVSSLGAVFNDYTNLGGPTHPLLYPTSLQHGTQNLNVLQKIVALYEHWQLSSMYSSLEEEEDEIAKTIFGIVPPLREQVKSIELLLLNVHPVWQGVRPVPKNVVHLGSTHLQDKDRREEISEELQQYLDSCTEGVVYVSFDINIWQWKIPEHLQLKLIRVFRELPYSVLWKWDKDISDLPHNVRIGKWFPQAELLKHPNVRLFISQCGQQSTDEAIAAGVPLLALPIAADEWRNAELVIHHNVGTALDLEYVEDEELNNIIIHTLRNQTYRSNMQRMRMLLSDAPAPSPVRAADAIDYVLRHTAGHIASPTLHVQWFQYMEIELFIIVFTFLLISLCVLCSILYYVFKCAVRRFVVRRVTKDRFKNKV